MWELRDWWCFSGEKCQFIEQLLVWVGGGRAGIKQNDISAAASDDRLISSLLCVCYKNVLTHLSTYILRASSSWSFWKTHIEETGEQRKKESSVKIASGSRWKREIIIIIYIWRGKHEISTCHLEWLFIGVVRHSETIRPERSLWWWM